MVDLDADLSDIQWQPLAPPLAPQVQQPSVARDRQPLQNSVASRIGLEEMLGSAAEGSSPGAVSPAMLRQFLLNASDSELIDVFCTLSYDGTYDPFAAAVRGRWRVRLAQQLQDDARDFVPVTVPVEVRNPKTNQFRLGGPTQRLVIGRPVFLEVTYEAASGSVPLFWASALAMDFTVH